jgi:hypothetical protein
MSTHFSCEQGRRIGFWPRHFGAAAAVDGILSHPGWLDFSVWVPSGERSTVYVALTAMMPSRGRTDIPERDPISAALTKDAGGRPTTPAMAAGIADRVWTARDIAALLD